MRLKKKVIKFLRWSEKYTKTDMVYLAKGSFWITTGKFLTSFFAMLTMIAFARWVPQKTYGTYQYVLSTVGILSIFTLPGMNSALKRAVAKGKEKMLSLCAKARLKWGFAATVIGLGISGWYFFQGNSQLALSFLIAALFLPFTRIFNSFDPFWQGRKRFDIENKYKVVINFLEALFLIPIIFFTDYLIFILLGYFISRTIFRAYFFKITLNKTKGQEKDEETIPYGKHLTLMSTATTIGEKIDKIIMWQFLGPAAIAIYSFAQLPISRIGGLISVTNLAFPKLAERDVKKIKKGILKKFLKFFLVTIPFALFVVLIAPYIYKILFPQYLDSVPFFRLLALDIVLIPFALLDTSLVTEMKKKELYITRFITPTLKTLLFLVLIPMFGIWGVVTAYLGSRVINSFLVLYFFLKI